jgi:hypothetical protein
MSSSWDRGRCSQFLSETVQEVSEKGLEICSIICGNARAQVNSLTGFLKSGSNESQMIIHVSCVDHMAHLMCKHVLDFDLFGIASKLIVNSLNSPLGRRILGRQPQKFVKTHWVCLVDDMHFILSRIGALNAMLQICEQPMVSDEYTIIYRVLTSLALFSRVMEWHNSRFCNVIPTIRAILRAYRVIWDNSRRPLKWRLLMDCL